MSVLAHSYNEKANKLKEAEKKLKAKMSSDSG